MIYSLVKRITIKQSFISQIIKRRFEQLFFLKLLRIVHVYFIKIAVPSVLNSSFIFKMYYFTMYLCKQILNFESRGLVFPHNLPQNLNPNLFLPMCGACN